MVYITTTISHANSHAIITISHAKSHAPINYIFVNSTLIQLRNKLQLRSMHQSQHHTHNSQSHFTNHITILHFTIANHNNITISHFTITNTTTSHLTNITITAHNNITTNNITTNYHNISK